MYHIKSEACAITSESLCGCTWSFHQTCETGSHNVFAIMCNWEIQLAHSAILNLCPPLSWRTNTGYMVLYFVLKEVNTRMYCSRKLKPFGVNSDMLVTFYNAVISYVALLCLVLSVEVEIFQNVIAGGWKRL